MMITALIVQRDKRLKTCGDNSISQDADQWGKSNFMNMTENMKINGE